MADIVTAVTTRLTAYAGTSALIGTRAYANHLRQNTAYPACAVAKEDHKTPHQFNADSDKSLARIVVGSFADDRAGAVALAAQTKLALSRYAGTSAGVEVTQMFFADEGDAEFDPSVRKWFVEQEYDTWFVG